MSGISSEDAEKSLRSESAREIRDDESCPERPI